MADVALLHVHGQEIWHDGVYLIGNRAGLEKLRKAIDEALRDGMDTRELTAADGEEYLLTVTLDNSGWQGERWQKALLPYTSDAAYDIREDAVSPVDHEPQIKEDTHADD